MKKILSIALVCLLFLVSCGGNESSSVSYKTDVELKTLTDIIYDASGNNDLTVADAGWVALNIPVDLSLCSESAIYISSTGTADMFGVFKANSEEDAEKLFGQSEDYLETLEANWMSEYLAEELPKIQNAKAIKCGLYVTFIIIDENSVNTAADNFKAALKLD